jgi:hypothetical protein
MTAVASAVNVSHPCLLSACISSVMKLKLRGLSQRANYTDRATKFVGIMLCSVLLNFASVTYILLLLISIGTNLVTCCCEGDGGKSISSASQLTLQDGLGPPYLAARFSCLPDVKVASLLDGLRVL